jgi:uncharacterized protein
MIVVSDTSPITTLIKIGKVDLLQKLYGGVLIPEAVREELFRSHASLPDFFQCTPVGNRSAVEQLLKEIDRGEAEAIVLAMEKRALLLIDEIEGRDVAAREGLRFIGLLGVLDQAKLNGLILSVKDTLREIEANTNFFLSEEMKNRALKRAGEL